MHTVIVLAVVAVLVVRDVRVHIRLIMTQIHRCRFMIVVRIVVPIVRRTPGVVMGHSPAREHRRRAHKHRTYVVVRTVHIRCADNLHIRRGVTHLGGQGRHILEDVMRQHSLDDNDVVVTVHHLHNTQIINISVVVEV